MTAEQIAKKYVHGLHDALTDRQEIKDMMTDIEAYAENYHQAKLKLLGVTDVVGRSEQLHLCPVCGEMAGKSYLLSKLPTICQKCDHAWDRA